MIGQAGNVCTVPSPNIKKWVKSKKLAVINAIDNGYISEQSAIDIWGLSKEELDQWRTMIQKHGPNGLRVTHLNKYRG